MGQAFYLLNHPAGPHRLFESSTFSILSLTFASSVLLFVCLFLVAILTRVTESFVVVLICISLAASDTEHIFFFFGIFTDHLNFFFGKISAQKLCPFKNTYNAA